MWFHCQNAYKLKFHSKLWSGDFPFLLWSNLFISFTCIYLFRIVEFLLCWFSSFTSNYHACRSNFLLEHEVVKKKIWDVIIVIKSPERQWKPAEFLHCSNWYLAAANISLCSMNLTFHTPKIMATGGVSSQLVFGKSPCGLKV